MHWLPVDVRSELSHDVVSGRCNDQKLINLEVSLCFQNQCEIIRLPGVQRVDLNHQIHIMLSKSYKSMRIITNDDFKRTISEV